MYPAHSEFKKKKKENKFAIAKLNDTFFKV